MCIHPDDGSLKMVDVKHQSPNVLAVGSSSQSTTG